MNNLTAAAGVGKLRFSSMRRTGFKSKGPARETPPAKHNPVGIQKINDGRQADAQPFAGLFVHLERQAIALARGLCLDQ